MKSKHLILGLLTGVISGAAYGLLTTKYTGAENRAYFKQYSQRVKQDFDLAKHDVQNLSAVISNLQEDALPKAQIFQNELKHSISDLKKEAEPRSRRIEERVAHMQKAADHI